MESFLWGPGGFSNQFPSNPVTQAVLTIKSYQNQWNLMGSMLF